MTKRKLEGRDHYVVPVVMIVEGVLSANNGPLLYTTAEMKASAAHWNGRPVVVYHPTMYGYGSAGAPEVFSKQRVGTVFNARVVDNRLKADAWLDPERLETVDNRVLEAVLRGEPMEVSTGLYTDNEPAEGNWNGRQYVAIARNYRPDHLAILPDQVGACSIADGAGLLVNVIKEEPLLMPVLNFSNDRS